LGRVIAAAINEQLAPLRKRIENFEARGIPEYLGNSANMCAAIL
jgi:hypothetical protein